MLPLHPGLKGKFLRPSYSLYKSPCRPQRVIASKVGISDLLRSTDVCRLDLDAAALPSMFDVSIRMFRSICGWLRDSRASQVSCFAVLHLFVVETLDFELYRFDLGPSVSTPGSSDPI